MPHWHNQPWQRNLSTTASGKTGAVHSTLAFCWMSNACRLPRWLLAAFTSATKVATNWSTRSGASSRSLIPARTRPSSRSRKIVLGLSHVPRSTWFAQPNLPFAPITLIGPLQRPQRTKPASGHFGRRNAPRRLPRFCCSPELGSSFWRTLWRLADNRACAPSQVVRSITAKSGTCFTIVTIRRAPHLFDLHAVLGAMLCCFFQFQGSNS